MRHTQPTSRTLLLALLLASMVGAGRGDAAEPSKPAATAKPKAATAASPKAATTPAATSSAVSPEALAILTRTGEVYRGLKSYLFEGIAHTTMTAQGQTQGFDLPFRIAAVKPSKLRTEIINPMMTMVTVSDGSKTWVYVPQLNQYTEQVAAPLTPSGSGASTLGNALASGTPIQRYLTASEGLVSARVIGKRTLDLGGPKLQCHVVEARYAVSESLRVDMSPNTLWIDQGSHLVARDSLHISVASQQGSLAMSTVTRFDVADVDVPVADTLFTFRPPAGARLVPRIEMPGSEPEVSPFVGKPAEDFSLVDLAGKKQRLSALKGRVVLIDFWATWCGPCRREMPNIVKLHQELTKKGLSVVAVNVGESAATVSAYLKKSGYVLPVWLDQDTQVAAKYGASAIPTLVVVDRQGKVVEYQAGLQNEEGLRGMLKKAGLE